MIESMTDVPTPDGNMDTFIVHPEEGGPFPCVFVLMDIWGLREELFDVARRIAVNGYYCILPNFWYRRGKVRFEYRDAEGKMLSMKDLPADKQAELKANMSLVTDAMALSDIKAAMAFAGKGPVKPGPMGSIGYCLGGRLALQAAHTWPDVFRASASLHGTHLVNDKPDSPHLFVDRFRGEMYCGFAEHDSLAPPSTIETLGKLMAGRKDVKYSALVHAGTHHGYSLPDRNIFDKQAANRDWERIMPMYRRQLG
jgi:carboxymethylenebutenolidase